jgi:hypothetical protein
MPPVCGDFVLDVPLTMDEARKILEGLKGSVDEPWARAAGFLEGHASRDGEVEVLKKKAEAYRQVAIDAEARRISDDWPDRQHTEDATKSVDVEAKRFLDSLPK